MKCSRCFRIVEEEPIFTFNDVRVCSPCFWKLDKEEEG